MSNTQGPTYQPGTQGGYGTHHKPNPQIQKEIQEVPGGIKEIKQYMQEHHVSFSEALQALDQQTANPNSTSMTPITA